MNVGRIARRLLVLPAAAALASCATTTLEVSLRTEPEGAACSLVRGGVVAASVAATPGTAKMYLDACLRTPEGTAAGPCTGPIEIVCTKEGYLDYRRSRDALRSADVLKQSPATVELTEKEQGIQVLEAIAAVSSSSIVGAPVAILFGAWAMAERTNSPRNIQWRPPVLPLTPATFASQSACDAWFDASRGTLVASAEAQRAYVARECRPFPCRASDADLCAHPECQKLRTQIETQLNLELDELRTLRSQVRILAP
jgi:hypothetical protein